jgi:hypothetical protein
MDIFDYSAGDASTSASGVAVGFTVALGVAVALAFPEALADADGSTVGDADGVASTACFTTLAEPRVIPMAWRFKNNCKPASKSVQTTTLASNIFDSLVIQESS